MTITAKQIDVMYQQKKFFYNIFDTEIAKGNNLKNNQSIRILQANDDIQQPLFFTNIDDLVAYTSNNKRFSTNTYFNLALTDNTGGKAENMTTRTVLAFDFDKKDEEEGFNHVDIINRFKSIGLWYHVLTDSGNGYHAYVLIESTTDLCQVDKVTKAIATRLGADDKATLKTQVLRVPLTFNVKDSSNIKQVNIIKMYESNIKRYDIDRLFKRFCTNEKDKQVTDGKIIQYTIDNTNIPSCIQKILLEGSTEGSRNADLQKIVVTLRQRNKTLSEISAIVKEWADKSNFKEFDYQVKHIYNNLKYAKLDCKGCNHKQECYSKIESEFDYPKDYNVLTVSEVHASKLKAKKRKGVKVMEANDLLLYGILKNNNRGLYRDEIIEDMTYRGKIRFGKNTLTKTLQSLEENGFIEVTGNPKLYRLKEVNSKIELTFNISFAATYEAVKGNISTEELKLYTYMRYLHNKQQREDTKALKGNLFQYNQVDLAKDMGLTQGRISVMINNLLEEKLLGIWYRNPSKNNGFDYNVYRLNY